MLADLDAAGEALMAYRRGDDSYEADAGAFLVAAALRNWVGDLDPGADPDPDPEAES